jgi:xanthine dehydrogenase accessory factor
MPNRRPLILVRGGGDLASGVILRLYRAGLQVVVSELPRPLAVRRTVSFAEAVYEGRHSMEGVTARLVERDQLAAALEANEIPVIVDPQADILESDLPFPVVVDARLTKHTPVPLPLPVPLHIGLGPGFQAGANCHAVVETRRSHTLGRVYWQGSAQPDSGQPEGDPRRVLRAASDGTFLGVKKIGEHCEAGELIGKIDSPNNNQQSTILSPLSGMLRGLIRDGMQVTRGLKIGDVDPRNDPSACFLVSDKALSIGGGVLEAILTRVDIRSLLWTPSALRAPPPNS